ncbi:thioredoxin [Nitzschia inconspicua]|uniref:Thioredoxin n=1 Tax=Nitzschia inconspicua TaxID=303405 RepID=A0A9K3K773_9STRA|nr:thioredoxin [Nitzschia inconspicua]KAG7368223.1 thioredoxin [Nitzschia inconspicua]
MMSLRLQSALVLTISLLSNATVVAFRTQEVRDVAIRIRTSRFRHGAIDSRRALMLYSAISAEQPESSLSGLVNGMLEAHKEIAEEAKELEDFTKLSSENPGMPLLGSDGVYNILTEEQLHNFRSAHADKLVILKFSSPVCKACRALKQKFRHLNDAPHFVGQPVVFADIVISNNKNFKDSFREYVTKQLNVRQIPSLQFYSAGNHLVNTVGCDPETGCSWTKIKQQMVEFVQKWAPEVKRRSVKGVVGVLSEDTESITHMKPSATPTTVSPSLLHAMHRRIRAVLFRHRDD